MELFRGKKITVMGLGLLGRGVGDVKFLAESGAELIVTDLKSASELLPSLSQLKDFPAIKYVLGEHRLEDFRDCDFILKAAKVPLDSPYIKEAESNGIPVEMSASLFAKLTPAMIIGVTGTRGKSTTTQLIYETLSSESSGGSSRRIFLGGNVRGVATLPMLPETRPGDIAVLELDSWQLQGFGASQISPHIAIFTTFFPDHQDYYGGSMDDYLDDKANIFRYQKKDDILIVSSQAVPYIKKFSGIESRIIVPEPMPSSWRLAIPGEHNRLNAALAVESARQIGVDEKTIRRVVLGFSGIAGRLERINEKDGVVFYNDTTATTPEATLAGISAFGEHKGLVLIMGGSDKMLDMSGLIEAIPKYCKGVVLLPGGGTERIKPELLKLKNEGLSLEFARTMDEAVKLASGMAKAGDIVLLSPGFASFGLFTNEFNRGAEFVKSVEDLP